MLRDGWVEMPGTLHTSQLILTTQLGEGPSSEFSWETVQDLFFSPERPFALSLNLLIIGLTVIAVVLTLRVLLQSVPRETRALNTITKLPSPSRADVEAAVRGSKSLLNARVQDLRAFKAQRHPIDPAALTGLSTAAFRDMLSLPRGIGRSLIILGLFGTLWGLGVSVTELARTLSTTGMDTQSLTRAILATLGGMQTAFGTTLMGIAGSLTVAVFLGAAQYGQSRALQRLERVVSTHLIPLYDSSEATMLAEVVRSLDEVQSKLAQDLDEIVVQVRRQGEALGEQLREEFDQIEAAFERRAVQLIETTGRALTTTLDILGERREGEPTLAEYVRTIRVLTEELDGAIRSAASMIPNLEERLLSLIERHRSGLEEALTAHNESAGLVARKQIEAAEALVQATDQGRAQSEALEETLSELAGALEAARESWKRTDEVVARVGESCYQAIELGLRSFVDELQQERVGTTEERERVARGLAQFERLLSTHLDRMQTERAASLRQATELVEAVRDAVQNAIRDVGSQLKGQGDEVGAGVREAIEELARELRVLVHPRRSLDGRGRSPGVPGGRRYPWDTPDQTEDTDDGATRPEEQ